MNNLTIVIPFRNGHETILKLLKSLPEEDIPVIIVDDVSTPALNITSDHSLKVIRLKERGYFSGAVNRGINECATDVLVLNQDCHFETDDFFSFLEENRKEYAMIGDSIKGAHPAWPNGYIQGTCMFIRRDAIRSAGLLNEKLYPLWGSTCELQLRICRKNFKVLPLKGVPGFMHDREGNFGSSIKELLREDPENRDKFIRTPPEISVIVPCYNHGKYLKDLVGSLLGGETTLGKYPGQSFQSFEVVIVDDCSVDNSYEIAKSLEDSWKGVHVFQTPYNGGTSVACNLAISKSHGKYIARIDGDDMRETNSLEMLYEVQSKNKHSMVYDDVTLFQHGNKNPKTWRMESYDFDNLLYKNSIHCGIMFPYEAWKEAGGYPEKMKHGRDDWAFNVALGVKGYCGIHVPNPGYLYRREGQNRTLVNTTEEWREKFLRDIQSIFPQVYAGRRPEMCCGHGRNGVTNNTGARMMASRPETLLAGSEGMILVEYLGASYGHQSFYGPVTGTQYVFDARRNKGYIDSRDAHAQSGRGILDLVVKGKIQFKEVVEEKVQEPAVVAKAKVSAPVAEAVMEAPAETSVLIKVQGVTEEVAEKLMSAGINTPEDIGAASIEELMRVLGWTKTRVKALKSVAAR